MALDFVQISEGDGTEMLYLQEAEGTFGVNTTSDSVGLPVSQIINGLSDTQIASFRKADWTTDAVQEVKSSAGKITKAVLFSTDDAVEGYVHLYNVAHGSVTVGTTTPVWTYKVPAGGEVIDISLNPELIDTAISVAVTTTYTGTTAPADDKIVVQFQYI